MINDFQVPKDALHFLKVLGKDPDRTRIRLIANKSSCFKGAQKESFNLNTLARWSQLKSGIYVVINDGGDSDESITLCRALFIEHDDIPFEQQVACWQGILPQPTMQVYTGGKSLHQYWVFKEPINVDQWINLTAKAIVALKSDPTVKNPSRVMRLPGFTYYNREGQSGPASCFSSCIGFKYSLEQLQSALAGIELSQPCVHSLKIKRTSHDDWLAARPCPICGRDLDEKCRLHRDATFIQCHVGDTFMPPSGREGAIIKGSDGQLWKRKTKTQNVFGDAISFSLVQDKQQSPKTNTKSGLIKFIQQEYGDRLQFNELKRRLEIDSQSLQDLNLMHCALAAEYDIHHTSSTVSDAFLFVGKQSTYNPVQRLLLASEQHEPSCDFKDIGTNYLHLVRPIESRVLAVHLLAAVYRAFHPGYQYDQILIMRGPQGIGKTRTIKALAGSPEHYISTSVLTNEKDFLIQLGSCWHCEFEEIDGHIDSRHEAQLKALISRHTDNYRAPYASSVQDQPRRCVFWGTTNQDKLLVDSTGNRRMMIIDLLHQIDHQLLERDLMQIWSAVMKAYRAGFVPQLTPEEISQVAQIAKESFKDDPWLGIIEASIDGTPVVFEHYILKSVLGMEVRQIKGGRSGDQRRVRDCLTQLGYYRYPNQVYDLNTHNKGYVKRTRGVWFAPGIEPLSNGDMIVELLHSVGKDLPVGPGFDKKNDPFLVGSESPF